MGTRLLAGGGAGITAASLTYPLDLVRTRLAAQVRSLHFVCSRLSSDKVMTGLFVVFLQSVFVEFSPLSYKVFHCF
jgi:hypothetical protein